MGIIFGRFATFLSKTALIVVEPESNALVTGSETSLLLTTGLFQLPPQFKPTTHYLRHCLPRHPGFWGGRLTGDIQKATI